MNKSTLLALLLIFTSCKYPFLLLNKSKSIKCHLNAVDDASNFERLTNKGISIKFSSKNEGYTKDFFFSNDILGYQNRFNKQIIIFHEFKRKGKAYSVIVCDSTGVFIEQSSFAGFIY